MKIAASFSSGRLIVYLSGELDHHEAGGAIRAIGALIEEHMPRECVIELSGLSFMDQARKVLEASGIDRLIAVAMNS